MGTDIHAYIEYRESPDSSWRSFGTKFSLDRDYKAFGYLAGVRFEVPHIPLRGVPKNIAWATSDDWWLRISDNPCRDEHGITFDNAMDYAELSCDIIVDSNGFPACVSNPDWHSATWMTLSEFEDALNRIPNDTLGNRWYGFLGAANALSNRGLEVRIIFWFDN
jgi:hypothetical protein